MGITADCKKAMIEHGVLMKDGRPAGADLMNKPALRVALVHTDEQGNLDPSMLSEDLVKYLQHTDRLDQLENLYTFPENIEEIVKEGIGYWHEGEIEFVSPQDNPDIQVVSYAGGLKSSHGFSSFPPNDLEGYEAYDGNAAIIGVNVFKAENPDFFTKLVFGEDTDAKSNFSGQPTDVILEKYVRHETGHALGIRHPDEALHDALEENPGICVGEEALELSRSFIMAGENSTGEMTADFYDDGVREVVRNAPSQTVKP